MATYGYPERRKNKNDKRAKSKYNRYKKGGRFRSQKISLKSGGSDEENGVEGSGIKKAGKKKKGKR